MTTDGPIAFLAARLDEDEAAAKAAQEYFAAYPPGHWYRAESAPWTHIARHDPARVLREVEAKRKIMTLADDAVSSAITDPYLRDLIVRAFAAVYSGQPDRSGRPSPGAVLRAPGP